MILNVFSLYLDQFIAEDKFDFSVLGEVKNSSKISDD